MKLLHIDSSITGDQSVSRQLTNRIAEALRRTSPRATTTYRDLAKDPLPHLSLGSAGERGGSHAAASLEEFLDADVVVIGAPMYNFTIPSQLKTWIDTLLIPGRTFEYTERGPRGLTGGKRVIVASSRGGKYSTGEMAALDHQEAYLRNIFRFIGVTDVEFVRAEGLSMGEESRRSAIEGALAHADALAEELAVAV